MLDFLKAIEEYEKSVEIVKLDRHDILPIKKCVLSKLKLKSENELRDRFEGIVFYENFHKKISGIIALEKFLETDLFSWDKINPKNYLPVVRINAKKVYILTSDFGELPELIPNFNLPVILIIRKDMQTLWIIGCSRQEKILSDKIIISSFNSFSAFNTAEELNDLIS